MADYPYTINSARVTPLGLQEQVALKGCNIRWKVLYSDITAAASANTAGDTAATVTCTLGTTPTNYYIDQGLVTITTAFAGVTSQALAMVVGTTSSTAALISSTSVFTVATLNMASTVPIMTNLKATAAVNLVAVFTNSGGGTPSTLTAGELNIYAHLVDVSDFGT